MSRIPELFPVDPTRTPAPVPPTPSDLRRARGVAEARNGVPEMRPYVYRPGEAERDAEIAARLAAILAEPERPRCPTCLYQWCECRGKS